MKKNFPNLQFLFPKRSFSQTKKQALFQGTCFSMGLFVQKHGAKKVKAFCRKKEIFRKAGFSFRKHEMQDKLKTAKQ